MAQIPRLLDTRAVAAFAVIGHLAAGNSGIMTVAETGLEQSGDDDRLPIELRELSFQTEDGVTLRGTMFAPEAPANVAVMSGAVGVPQATYRHFARWLAETQNIACLTYTYRDMEDPNPETLRASRARLRDWAITDGQAARDAALAEYPGLPLWMIGHSLGGMMISKQPRVAGIARVITIGSGVVSHHDHPMPYRALVWLFWFVLGPLSLTISGYLPGRKIGLGADLPPHVFQEWKTWCTNGARGFTTDRTLPPADWKRCAAPLRIVAMLDDEICPPHAAGRLAQVYEAAPVSRLALRPENYGLRRLGHFGVFSPGASDTWPDIIAHSEGG